MNLNFKFLGLDNSIAPLFKGFFSFINFTKKFSDFDRIVTTNFFATITNALKSMNIKKVGLCGLMFPCLEDFEFAKLYEQDKFSIERNMFLSLHSGLGIDTYPIGIDENLK